MTYIAYLLLCCRLIWRKHSIPSIGPFSGKVKKINFGENLIKMIDISYKDIESTVMNSGYNCGWFKLKRGIRQGRPISGTVFLLVAEILAQKIRNNQNIEGVEIDDTRHKINQFADDTTCTLKNWRSVIELFKVAKYFSLFWSES